jgi:hypothetical protein
MVGRLVIRPALSVENSPNLHSKKIASNFVRLDLPVCARHMTAGGSDPIPVLLRAYPPSIRATMRNMATPAGRAVRFVLLLSCRLD